MVKSKCDLCIKQSICTICQETCDRDFTIFEKERLKEHDAKLRADAIDEFAIKIVQWKPQNEEYMSFRDVVYQIAERDMNIAYNQALEDFFNKCWEENIMFYSNPMDCLKEVKEQLTKQKMS